MGQAYSSRGLVYFHNGRKHGSVHTDIVLKELKVLHFDLQIEGEDCHSRHSMSIGDLKTFLHTSCKNNVYVHYVKLIFVLLKCRFVYQQGVKFKSDFGIIILMKHHLS